MRTVKRATLPLNAGKLAHLKALISVYAKEKRHWLDVLRAGENQARLAKPREIRDKAVRANYQSPQGLQGRHWKLALQDVQETWDKHWQAVFVEVRRQIARREDFSDLERRYAYWLLRGYAQFSSLMQGQTPPPTFEIEAKACRRIAGYVAHGQTTQRRSAAREDRPQREVRRRLLSSCGIQGTTVSQADVAGAWKTHHYPAVGVCEDRRHSHRGFVRWQGGRFPS
jgi:hypothetical protein